MASGDYAAMRASDADRSRVQDHLNEAFAEGRLSKDEWDERATALHVAVTYGDLNKLTMDLPQRFIGTQVTQPEPRSPLPRQRASGLATASLVCAFGQLLVGFPAGIAAVILGHRARRRIAITGEQGDGIARLGLIIGYIGIVTAILWLLAFVLGSSAPPGLHP